MNVDDILERVKDFKSEAPNFFGRDIPVEKLANAKLAHRLSEDVSVFYLHDKTVWGGAKESLVVTDQGVSYKYFDDPMGILWSDIYDVQVDRKAPAIHVFANGKRYLLGMSAGGALPVGLDAFLIDLAAKQKAPFQIALGLIESILQDSRSAAKGKQGAASLSEALKVCDELLVRSQPNTVERLYKVSPANHRKIAIRRAETQWLMGNWQSATADLLNALETMNVKADVSDIADCYDLLSLIAVDQHRQQDAIVYLSKCLALTTTPERRSEFQTRLWELNSHYPIALSQQRLTERQLICCTKQIPSQTLDDVAFATARQLRETTWKFQVGHPMETGVYVCHPLKPDIYFTLEEFDLKMFEDKYAELIELFEALGASRICVEAIAGSSEETFTRVNKNLGLAAKGMGKGASGAHTAEISDDRVQVSQQKYTLSLDLRPTGSVSVPAGLVWFPHEPLWQKMADSCIHGRCEKFAIELRSDVDFSANAKTIGRITAAAKFFGGEVDFEKYKETERQVRARKNTVWVVTATFPKSTGLAGQGASAG